MGEDLGKSGNVDRALADHRLTARLLEAIHAAEPKDVEARVTLAETKVKIGSLLAKKGDSKSALDIYQKVLSDLEPFAHADPPNLEALYACADASANIGQLIKDQTATEKSSARKIELWTRHDRGSRGVHLPGREFRTRQKSHPLGFKPVILGWQVKAWQSVMQLWPGWSRPQNRSPNKNAVGAFATHSNGVN